MSKPIVRWPFVVAGLGVLGLAIWRRKDVATTAKKLFPNRTEEERAIRKAFLKWAVIGNLDPDFMQVIPKVETGYRLNSVNKKGRDGDRGGAWGASQITEKTARALGYTGKMEAFLTDAELCAQWTAKILNDHRKRKPLDTLADYIAAWNAGKDNADANNNNELEELGDKHQTRTDYLPKAKAALAYVQQTRGFVS